MQIDSRGEGDSHESIKNKLEKIIAIWKTKLESAHPISANVRTVLKQEDNLHATMDNILASLESVLLRAETFPPFLGVHKNRIKQNRLSEFMYNISMYVQNQGTKDQEENSWEKLLYRFIHDPTEKSPRLPILSLQDFLVSLRGSQNLNVLLGLLESILKAFSNSHTALSLLGQNWEMLSGLIDTLFQALLSGTLTQTSTVFQGLLCVLMGQTNCGFSPDHLQHMMLPFDKNWKPVINVQSGSAVSPHGKYRPFSVLPGSFKEKKLNSSSNETEMQNVFQIFYRSKEKEKGIIDDVSSNEDLWQILDSLHHTLLKRMERSAYDNLNKKVFRMTGSLMNRVSAVIGVPQSDQNGKCSAGTLQQLLLWGIKHNITWNIHAFGFASTSFPSAPPILTCGKPVDIQGQAEDKIHNITKRSKAEVSEELQPYSEVLEAVCNETIPQLPGVSNFTVFLYCNMQNSTGYSVESTYDLRAACLDAAWYLLSMEEDSFWLWVCREYFPVEFNITVCKNTIPRHSHNTSLMHELCTNLPNISDGVRELRNNIKCSNAGQGIAMNAKILKNCLLENKTVWANKICNNGTFLNMPEDTRVWVSKLCNQQELKTIAVNSSALRSSAVCDYKSWDPRAFKNVTLVEQCKGVNITEFKDHVCRNSTLYDFMMSVHPWIIDYCRDMWTNSSTEGRCFLQKLIDMLPFASKVDSSQLCKSPISYIIGLISQISQCENNSTSWALNVHYLLKMVDFIFTLSDTDQISKETRDRLKDAILLSSLLDNSSFWTSFKINSSVSILQTVEWYLTQENSDSDKEDLLSCFSPVLWELIQNEENATAFEILLQEYLQMPRDGFQKVLMSAENHAMERFLSLMHRSWPRIKIYQHDEKGLETLTSMVMQKIPLLTPQIFVDLSQFIPFMSVSDIISFPLSLLANQSVLDAIRIYSPDMKLTQKRAFAKRLLQANMFGAIPSWPPDFLKSVQPLLPYLPYCHFVQLTSNQIKLLADGWKDVKLGMVQGRYVAQSLMNRSGSDIVDEVLRLGSLVCYLTYEDLQSFLPLQDTHGLLEKKLLQCITDRILSPHGRLAYSLSHLFKRVPIHTVDISELIRWRCLLSELGVPFFKKLPDSHVDGMLPMLQAADLTPAQAFTLFKTISTKKNASAHITELVLCNFHSLIPALSPEILRSISASLLSKICQCLKPSLSLLSPAQKAAIMYVLRRFIHERDVWPMQLACLLPFTPLKLLHLDTQILLRNVSLYGQLTWTPQQTQYLWKKIRAGANLTKNTILTLGSLANGIECDILQQLNTISDIRDVVKYLHGIPSGLRKSLRKCILEEMQMHPGLSWEDTSWIGPEFITDLPVKLIERLSNESVKVFLEHAHKYPRSFLELQPHKKSAFTQRALHILHVPAHEEISVEDLDMLGPLVGFIGEENIAHINRKHLLLHLDVLKTCCLSAEFTGSLGKILTEDDMLGHPSQWTKKDIESIGRLLFFLTSENVQSIPKEVLGRDTLEWLLESQRSWEDSDMGRTCRKQCSSLQENIRRNKMILASTVTKSSFRGFREPIPSCADMRITFPSAWSAAQISGMSASDFEDCLGLFSQDADLTADQAKAALSKIKQLFGPVKNMNIVEILQIGHLSSYMSDRELQDLEISDWGIVSFLGNIESWSLKQMKTLVTSILRKHKKTASDLDLTDITALGNLLCGLGVEELKTINKQEFSQAAVFAGSLKLKCSEAQLETMAELLTSGSAFGTVSRWGPEIFTEIGTLAAGLPDIVLSSLIRDQIQGLTPDAISLIPAPKFAVVFSPAQLSLFTSDQATAVTTEQYEQLSYQQRQAISSAQYEGDILYQDPRGENSTGSLVAWKPVLYLTAAILFLI
ncbi:stereocilin [Bombina bombina]|uniref:stereocilin n=1 Tax=Bombina bombina TaxID=8345 RepID=UPI00235AF89D|nr:stereocilin [Bombina bombina]